MKIAVAVCENSLDGIVPKTLEEAQGLLIVESDDLTAEDYVLTDWIEALDAYDCEVLLCGDMIEPAFFEQVANRGITRYRAAGLTAQNAVTDAMHYQLENITDFVGGTGCHSHEGECNCGGHHD